MWNRAQGDTWFFVAAGLAVAVAAAAAADEPLALRLESMTVAPASGPVLAVQVENRSGAPYRGTVAVKPPDGWRLAPATGELSLKPGETARLGFKVERGANNAANSYPMEVAAAGPGGQVVRRQTIVVASAPYSKPTIDGDPSDWKDAIPVAFASNGKQTTVSTFWNRKRLCVLAAVEEDALQPFRADRPAGPFDAVQLAVAAAGTTTGARPDDAAGRFEFLLLAVGEGDRPGGKCFRLAEPATRLGDVAKVRALAGLDYADAELAVRREGRTTYYECGLPMEPMRGQLQPSEGREFCLSLLVHDPDGTGLRDWGEAAGLWPWQRNRMAWSQWQGAKWGPQPPFDNKTAWGMCSSVY